MNPPAMIYFIYDPHTIKLESHLGLNYRVLHSSLHRFSVKNPGKMISSIYSALKDLDRSDITYFIKSTYNKTGVTSVIELASAYIPVFIDFKRVGDELLSIL